MAEQDYKKRIEEAKTALAGYSEAEKKLRALYDQAIKNADAAYKAESERVEAQAKKDKTAAAVDTKKLEKNLDQTLASRGLAFSGENAQTALDLSLLLQNRLNDIDADAADKQNTLAIENAEAKQALEEKKLSSAQKQYAEQTGLAAKLAGLEQEAAPDPGISVPTDGKVNPMEVLQNVAGKVYDAAQETKEKRYVTPAISAANLAKQMVNTISGGKGTVMGDKQQMGISNLLAKMEEQGQLEPSYRKQLLLNLQSLGFSYDPGDEGSNETHLKNNAANEYFKSYNRFYRLYSLADLPEEEAAKRAVGDAKLAELRYLYDHTFNNDQFRKLAGELALSEWLETFYQRLYA